jgi:hypothetical protein
LTIQIWTGIDTNMYQSINSFKKNWIKKQSNKYNEKTLNAHE